MTDEVETTVVEMLASHEDALGDLYATYAVRFPSAAHFWEDLSAQEYGHGSMLRDLAARAGVMFVENGRFQLATLELARDFVRDVTTVAETTELSLERALGIAYDLEEGTIERRAYEVADGDTEEVRAVLDHLRVSSEGHRDSIGKYLSGLRSGK